VNGLRVIVSRALDLLLGSRRDRRLDAEVDLHLSLLTDEGLARGMTPEAARAEARRRFGGVDQVKARYRDQRGLPGVDALRQDARMAMRVLLGDRRFTLTAVLVLALGIGVNNMMFTILNAHTIRGLPIRDVDRVIYVSTRDPAGVDRGLSWPELEDLRQAVVSADFGAFVTGPASLANEHEAPDRVDRSHVDIGTFAQLGIDPFLGRSFTPGDAEPGAPAVVLLSERLWRARYDADAGVLGRTVLVDGIPATIIGVVNRESGFPAVADVWQPLERMAGPQAPAGTTRVLRVIGRVRRGADVAMARVEIETVFSTRAAAHAEPGAEVRAHVVPINERFLGRLLDPAWLAFMAVGCLVALISCANVANLLLGRALHRDREIALRTSLGATRSRIVRQLLIESSFLAGAGGALGLVVGVAGVRFFRQGIPDNVLPYWLDYAIDRRVLFALVLVTAVATLLCGLVPALQASRSHPQVTLRQGGPTVARTLSANRWTTAFLVLEIALGVVMLANLGLAWRLSRTGLATDAALYAGNVLTATVTLPADRYPDAAARRGLLGRVEEALDGAPGILSVAATATLPLRPVLERRLRIRSAMTRDPIPVRVVMISPAYFDTLRLKVTDGRALGGEDSRAGAAAMLVNEHLAATHFAGRSPVGERIGFVSSPDEDPAEWHTVVGVAPTIRQRVSSEPEAIVYQPLDTSPPATLSLLARTSLSPAAASTVLRQAVLGIDPHLPLYNLSTLRQSTTDAEWNGRVSNRLLLALTGIAVCLAAIGLYAVTARAVAARRREIGIRLAVGAAPRQIRGLVLGQAFRRVASGTVVGAIGVFAWEAAFVRSAGASALSTRATLADPYVFLSIAGALSIITVLACLAPLRRAQAVSPSIALGQD
jgi:predicted permease